MVKVLSIRKRADSMLEDVFRALFEEIDPDKIRKEVADLRDSAPGFSPAHHARVLTRRTAIRCAASGAVTGLPLGVVAIGTLSADLAYLMYQQFRLILGIATIYGHEPSSRERFNEAFSCLAYTSGAGIGKQGLGTLARDRFTRLVPFIGAVSGGALNFAAVHAVARSAMKYYESRIEPALADEIWAEGDREHA